MSLAQLAAVSDIVVVAASLSQETNKIVSAEFLSNMKTSAFLINISRGGLVDQEALVTALNTGSIKGNLLTSFASLVRISVQELAWMSAPPSLFPPAAPC